MSNSSETLKPGDRAPHFSLAAANLPGRLVLAEMLVASTVVLEFLRGTW